MREPVLVTGAGGFIGRSLVKRLADDGVAVRAFLMPGEAVPEAWSPPQRRIDPIRGDVTRPGTVEGAMEGVGTVVHLAAVVTDWGPWELYRRVTVDGTRTVLTAAADRGVRAVLASSIVVYGDRLGRARCAEDLPWGRSLGNYGRAKQAQERLAWDLARERGLELSVVRPANVFGPGSRPWVEMVLPLLRTRQVTLICGGHQNAGLCHVENLADLLILACGDDAVGGVFNGADGGDISWRRYFGDLARLAGTPPPRSMPRWAAGPLASILEVAWTLTRREGRPPITREALNLVGADHDLPVDRARERLGYRPRVGYDAALAGLADDLAGSVFTDAPA